MAPTRTKKRKSSTEEEARAIAPKSPTRTPTHSPHQKVVGITETQKQALIDNLQLEVTERARKLRAQYALQAQSLRTRIELRINRIPASLRKVNMGELYEKYKEILEVKQKKAPETKHAANENTGRIPDRPVLDPKEAVPVAALSSRGVKRKSDTLEFADKENTSESAHEIPNPKKRSKATKVPSRQVTNPSTVLSPKSANSRTLPQSPIRPALGSPQKSYLSHAVSPLKPFPQVKQASPAKAAAAAATADLAAMMNEKPKTGRPKVGAGRKATNPPGATKGGTLRSKRGAAPVHEPEEVRKASNTSNLSSASNATTIVKNSKKGSTVARKKNEVGVGALGKRVAAGPEAPQPGRRVLRKRP